MARTVTGLVNRSLRTKIARVSKSPSELSFTRWIAHAHSGPPPGNVTTRAILACWLHGRDTLVTEFCLSSFVFPDAAPTVSAARSHQSGAVNLNSILTANPKRRLFCPVGRQRVSDELPLISVSGLRVNS